MVYCIIAIISLSSLPSLLISFILSFLQPNDKDIQRFHLLAKPTKGRFQKWKKIVEYSTKGLTPPALSEKKLY